MNALDEKILRTWFRMEKWQEERLRLARVLHPETFTWAKRGAPPKQSWSTLMKVEEWQSIGWNEAMYQKCVDMEAADKAELERLASGHPLGEHFDRLHGLSMYLCGAFIAAGGDIERAPTVSAFWTGMGLGMVDGKAPRKTRGGKGELPAMPHVTKVGEQIRQQIVRVSGGKLRAVYDRFRAEEEERFPDKVKMFRFKSAQRKTQKMLYACLWREWRRAYGLPAPDPYAFGILKHADEHMVRIEDLYGKVPSEAAA